MENEKIFEEPVVTDKVAKAREDAENAKAKAKEKRTKERSNTQGTKKANSYKFQGTKATEGSKRYTEGQKTTRAKSGVDLSIGKKHEQGKTERTKIVENKNRVNYSNKESVAKTVEEKRTSRTQAGAQKSMLRSAEFAQYRETRNMNVGAKYDQKAVDSQIETIKVNREREEAFDKRASEKRVLEAKFQNEQDREKRLAKVNKANLALIEATAKRVNELETEAKFSEESRIELEETAVKLERYQKQQRSIEKAIEKNSEMANEYQTRIAMAQGSIAIAAENEYYLDSQDEDDIEESRVNVKIVDHNADGSITLPPRATRNGGRVAEGQGRE